jgi:hypothetical protein
MKYGNNASDETIINLLKKYDFLKVFKNDLNLRGKFLSCFAALFFKVKLGLKTTSFKFNTISKLKERKYTYFFSTNQGILTATECKKRKITETKYMNAIIEMATIVIANFFEVM